MRFAGIPDAERNKTIQTGFPIVLQCEVSDSSAQVHWYKDGSKLLPQNGIDIIADSLVRKLVVHSAEVAHSGLFCCRTKGDTITFSVDIKGDFTLRDVNFLFSKADTTCDVLVFCPCNLSAWHFFHAEFSPVYTITACLKLRCQIVADMKFTYD